MKKRLTKADIMRDYSLSEVQFAALQGAIVASAKTLETANPDAKAIIWGIALQNLRDGKSFIYVLDVVKATGR